MENMIIFLGMVAMVMMVGMMCRAWIWATVALGKKR